MRLQRGWGDDNISIHAPPRGATRLQEAIERDVSISIHAPPRGATKAFALRFPKRKDFNSRPSARGDPCRACCRRSP